MSPPSRDVLKRVEAVLSEHPVQFAMLFGSTVRGDDHRGSDVDLAVDFEEGPGDVEYTDAYLDLIVDLEDALGVDVDVVTFSSMSPRFASVVLEDGLVVVGGEERRRAIERQVAGGTPSTEEARERVAAAADRLATTDG